MRIKCRDRIRLTRLEIHPDHLSARIGLSRVVVALVSVHRVGGGSMELRRSVVGMPMVPVSAVLMSLRHIHDLHMNDRCRFIG